MLYGNYNNLKINRYLLNTAILCTIWLFTTLLAIQDDSLSIKLLFMILWGAMALVILVINNPNHAFSFNRNVSNNPIKTSWFSFLVYAMLVTVFNALIRTTNNYEFSRLLGIEIVYIIFPYIIMLLVSSKIDTAKFLIFYKNIMLFFCIIGFFEYITKIQFYTSIIGGQNALENFLKYGMVTNSTYRITLVFYHPIYYGVLLTVMFVCLLHYPYKTKIVNIIAYSLCLFNLILSQTRTAWLATGLVMIVYLMNEKKFKSRIKIKNIALFLVLILIVIYFFLSNTGVADYIKDVFINRLFNVTVLSAAGARIANLGLIGKAFEQRGALIILGGGDKYGISLLQNNPMIDNWTNAIDNQYVTFLLDYGIIGVCIILYFAIRIVRCYIRSVTNENKTLSLSLIAILISLCFFEMYGFNMIYYTYIIFMSMVDENEKTHKLHQQSASIKQPMNNNSL